MKSDCRDSSRSFCRRSAIATRLSQRDSPPVIRGTWSVSRSVLSRPLFRPLSGRCSGPLFRGIRSLFGPCFGLAEPSSYAILTRFVWEALSLPRLNNWISKTSQEHCLGRVSF